MDTSHRESLPDIREDLEGLGRPIHAQSIGQKGAIGTAAVILAAALAMAGEALLTRVLR